MGHLQDLQSSWDEFGRIDPLWAVATDPSKKGNKWSPEEFFTRGIEEIDTLVADLENLGITIHRRRALDFGCGVGRLTQALARHFDTVVGVDIAPSMIEQARKFNRFGDRCTYSVNSAANLRMFKDETFDLVYTSYVLQHIQPAYAKTYIKEFLRVLAPDGLLVFLTLSTKATFWGDLYYDVRYPLNKLYARAYKRIKGPIMESHFMRHSELLQLLEANEAKAIDVTTIKDTPYWSGSRYCVVKASRPHQSSRH